MLPILMLLALTSNPNVGTQTAQVISTCQWPNVCRTAQVISTCQWPNVCKSDGTQIPVLAKNAQSESIETCVWPKCS
ncbi:MAG: hypothetical protein A3G41_04705 [Elusimicrobia bacterium RIFCSPLOWO2_12_FULL_59_9]|nr:MAG: hypothetical protein A3G41_04705 [Elusimicrobia bacterium RIFCSPLOWO2_12_FULL_59_9]